MMRGPLKSGKNQRQAYKYKKLDGKNRIVQPFYQEQNNSSLDAYGYKTLDHKGAQQLSFKN